MTNIATLGLAIDSSQAVTAKTNLAALVPAAAAAASAVSTVGTASQTASSKVAAAASATQAASIGLAAVREAAASAVREANQMTAGVSALRAQLDPYGAALNVLNKELAEYAMFAERGAISTTELGMANAAAQAKFAAVTGALNNQKKSLVDSSGAVKLNTFQMQNMAFQMNDMATMLASGQSPFVMLMQQGMQIGQIFGPGVGVSAALRATGTAIVSFVTNPINLAVLAIAAAAGAVAWLWSKVSNSAGAEEALKRHKDLIDRIRDAYGDAGRAATEYGKTAGIVLKYDAQREQEATLKSLSSGMRTLANDLSLNVVPSLNTLQNFWLRGATDVPKLNSAVANFIIAAQNGTASATAFEAELSGIGSTAQSSQVHTYIAAIREMLGPLMDLEAQAKQTRGALGLFVGTPAPGFAKGLFQGWSEQDAKDSLRSQLQQFLKPSAEESAAAREAKQQQEAIDGVIKSLAFQEAQLGRTAREQAIYNALNDAGVSATSKYGQAISEAAGRLYDMEQAHKKWTDAIDSAKTLTQGFFSDLRSSLQQGASLFDALSSAAGRLLDKLLDMALNQAINALFANLAGSLFGGGGVSVGSSLAGAGGVGAFVRHSGSGPGETATRRYVHPAYFDDAPRYHGGRLAPGEQAAIIRDDESVLTPAQMRAVGNRGGNVEVHVHNAPPGTSTKQSRTADGGTRIDVMLGDMLADMIDSGESKVNRSFERRYGVRPQL